MNSKKSYKISQDYTINNNKQQTPGYVAQIRDDENPFCVKINATQLIQYDKQQQAGKNVDPLNSFSFPNYGTSTKDNDNGNRKPNQPSGGVVNVATIIGNIGWFQLVVLVFSGLRECTVGYDALITSIMLQPEHNFVCTSDATQNYTISLLNHRSAGAIDEAASAARMTGLVRGGSRPGGTSFIGNNQQDVNDTLACSYVLPTNLTQELACDSWTFPEHDPNKASLIVEWSLVCDRSFYVALIESSFFMGLLFGNIIWGYLADRIGRKKAYILSHLIATIAGGLSLVVSDVRLFIFFRFVAATGSIGYNILYTIQMELIGTKHRSYATMFNHLGWGMGAISIPLMASITSSSRIMLSVTPLIALLMLPWAFWLPESSRWLMARGKFSQARKELIRAAKFNGKEINTKLENLICSLNDKIVQDKARQRQTELDHRRQEAAAATASSKQQSQRKTSSLNSFDSSSAISQATEKTRVRSIHSGELHPDGVDDIIIIPDNNFHSTINNNYHNDQQKQQQHGNMQKDRDACSIISSSPSNVSSNISTYRLLFSNPKLVRDTLIISYCSFSGHLFYYVQTIDFGEIKNLSIEANFISSGAGEWFSLVVGAIALRYLSRRTCMSICLFIVGSSFLVQSLIDSSLVPQFDTKLIVSLNNSVGTVAALLLIFVVLIVNQEVYPTVIRQSGSSIGNTLGELGSTLAPWLIQLNRSMGLWRADLMCATMCFAGVIGSQFLTKTDDIELEDV